MVNAKFVLDRVLASVKCLISRLSILLSGLDLLNALNVAKENRSMLYIKL